MTKTVALVDKTYRRLKLQKRKGESFSQTIERLLCAQRKDPMVFVKKIPKSRISMNRRRQEIEANREASWEDV